MYIKDQLIDFVIANFVTNTFKSAVFLWEYSSIYKEIQFIFFMWSMKNIIVEEKCRNTFIHV